MSDTGQTGGNAGQPDLGIPGIDDVSEIGRSAGATTYRVRDTASGRRIVVKVLNAANLDAGAVARFEREQQAMASLGEHPNLVTVFGHGFTADDRPYIVTEEATGGSVAERVSGPRPMTGPDIMGLGVRLAGALESAHRVGVVHGDLRPEDVLLLIIGEPLLADFGVVGTTGATVEQAGDPKRMAHAAPEQLDGVAPSTSTDIYGLSSVLYTLLAGEAAFVRDTDTSVIPVIKRIASDPVPDLRKKGVPEQVAQVVERGMAKNPAERLGSAQELGRTMQQAQVALGLPMTEMTVLGQGAPAAAPPPTATQTMATTPVPPPPGGPPLGPPGGGPTPPGRPSNKTPLIVGAAAAVVLVALVIVFAIASSQAANDFFSAYAESRGLTRTGDKGSLPPVSPLLRKGDRRYTDEIFSGLLPGGLSGALALYTYEETSTDSKGNRDTTYYHFTVALSQLPETAPFLSELALQRRSGFRFLDKAEDAFRTRQRVEIESTVADKKFEIFTGKADDLVRARQVFSPSFVIWLAEEAHENVAFELNAGAFVVNSKGHLKTAEELDAFCEAAALIARRLDEEACE